jgi:hypothetical protein
MWRRVVSVWTDVSEDRIASIFGVEKFATAATCSHWFLARRFFYPEDGDDTICGFVEISGVAVIACTSKSCV